MSLRMTEPQHFQWRLEGRVGVITLNRPERKNPLTFESYAELRDLFRGLRLERDVHAIVAPLTKMDPLGLLNFTRMTGDLVIAMRQCPQPILAAVDGVCAGAGAILAMASDLRYGTERAKVAFLFSKVGLAGCDMGACAMLPRIIGQGRAAELLYTGRTISGAEGERWGFFNALHPPETLLAETVAA